MKRIFLSLMFAGGLGLISAQITPQNSEKMQQRRDDAWTKAKTELQLSPAQEQQLRALDMQYRNQAKQMRDENKEMMKQRRAQREADVRKILTPEQYQKWTERKQMMQQRRHSKNKLQHHTPRR